MRAKVSGTASRPRLSVFRSNKLVHLQLVDDAAGRTLAASRSKDAAAAGRAIAEKAAAVGVKEAVFDRGGFSYHGRIKAAADAARQAGLKI